MRGDTVDLTGSLLREVAEEIGLTSADFTAAPGWFAVLAGPRIAHMKLLQAVVPAAELAERIRCFIAGQTKPELTDIHVVRTADDITAAMPAFVAVFLAHIWRQDA